MRGGCTISVILSVLNEAAGLARTLHSLTAQRLDPGDALEILVIDGGSSDGSRAAAASAGTSEVPVRLVANPRRTTPHALNLGLGAARGEYVAILGAHCTYAADYIAVCLRELARHGAVGCSGRVVTRAAGRSLGAMLAYWTMGHPLGVSSQSFRTQPEGYADTIPYPVFRRDALLAAGGYDEAMTRNQDNDMNYRLRRAGHRLYCTWATACEYRARGDVRSLLQYADGNGRWCGVSARRAPGSLGRRHYVPALFVAAAVMGGGAALTGLAAGARPLAALGVLPIAAHLAAGQLAGLAVALRERDLRALLLPPVLLAFHLRYGWRFYEGLFAAGRGVTGRRPALTHD